MMRGQSNKVEELSNSLIFRHATGNAMQRQWFANEIANSHARVQRRIRVLKHDLHFPSDLTQVFLAKLQDISASKNNPPRSGFD